MQYPSAGNAGYAGYASYAGYAGNASYAGNAGYASNASYAGYASNAGNANATPPGYPHSIPPPPTPPLGAWVAAYVAGGVGGAQDLAAELANREGVPVYQVSRAAARTPRLRAALARRGIDAFPALVVGPYAYVGLGEVSYALSARARAYVALAASLEAGAAPATPAEWVRRGREVGPASRDDEETAFWRARFEDDGADTQDDGLGS